MGNNIDSGNSFLDKFRNNKLTVGLNKPQDEQIDQTRLRINSLRGEVETPVDEEMVEAMPILPEIIDELEEELPSAPPSRETELGIPRGEAPNERGGMELIPPPGIEVIDAPDFHFDRDFKQILKQEARHNRQRLVKMIRNPELLNQESLRNERLNHRALMKDLKLHTPKFAKKHAKKMKQNFNIAERRLVSKDFKAIAAEANKLLKGSSKLKSADIENLQDERLKLNKLAKKHQNIKHVAKNTDKVDTALNKLVETFIQENEEDMVAFNTKLDAALDHAENHGGMQMSDFEDIVENFDELDSRLGNVKHEDIQSFRDKSLMKLEKLQLMTIDKPPEGLTKEDVVEGFDQLIKTLNPELRPAVAIMEDAFEKPSAEDEVKMKNLLDNLDKIQTLPDYNHGLPGGLLPYFEDTGDMPMQDDMLIAVTTDGDLFKEIMEDTMELHEKYSISTYHSKEMTEFFDLVTEKLHEAKDFVENTSYDVSQPDGYIPWQELNREGQDASNHMDALKPLMDLYGIEAGEHGDGKVDQLDALRLASLVDNSFAGIGSFRNDITKEANQFHQGAFDIDGNKITDIKDVRLLLKHADGLEGDALNKETGGTIQSYIENILLPDESVKAETTGMWTRDVITQHYKGPLDGELNQDKIDMLAKMVKEQNDEPVYTTLAIGEEDGGAPGFNPDDPVMATMAIGEEDSGGNKPAMLIEGPFIEEVMHDEMITTLAMGEEGDGDFLPHQDPMQSAFDQGFFDLNNDGKTDETDIQILQNYHDGARGDDLLGGPVIDDPDPVVDIDGNILDLADADGSGELDNIEFGKGHQMFKEKLTRKEKILRETDALLDLNKDGKVDQLDHNIYLDKANEEQSQVANALDLADANGDGEITKNEYNSAFMEMVQEYLDNLWGPKDDEVTDDQMLMDFDGNGKIDMKDIQFFKDNVKPQI